MILINFYKLRFTSLFDCYEASSFSVVLSSHPLLLFLTRDKWTYHNLILKDQFFPACALRFFL